MRRASWLALCAVAVLGCDAPAFDNVAVGSSTTDDVTPYVYVRDLHPSELTSYRAALDACETHCTANGRELTAAHWEKFLVFKCECGGLSL